MSLFYCLVSLTLVKATDQNFIIKQESILGPFKSHFATFFMKTILLIKASIYMCLRELYLMLYNAYYICSNLLEWKSFLESNSPNILALCETHLVESTDSGNFSVRGYLPLIQKDSITHMHGLAVYVKDGFPFARDSSLENSADSYLCFRQALLHLVFCFFFLYQSLSPSLSLCTVFDSISSNIDEILSIHTSTICLFLKTS